MGHCDASRRRRGAPRVRHRLAAQRAGHQGTRGFGGYIVERRDPRGGTYYWIGYQPQESEIDEASDIAAIRSGHISVTPLHLDLTHEGMRRKLGAQFETAPVESE